MLRIAAEAAVSKGGEDLVALNVSEPLPLVDIFLLVTGNTIAQSVRERTSELAVLKTVGFSNERTLLLVLAESTLIAVIGGGLGLTIGWLAVAAGDPTHGFLPIFYFPTRDLIFGVIFVFLLGLVAGILPAVQAMRLRIVDALRRA